LVDALRRHFRERLLPHVAQTSSRTEPPSWFHEIVSKLEIIIHNDVLAADALLLEAVYRHATSMDRDPQNHDLADHEKLHWLIIVFRTWLMPQMESLSARSDDLRRDLILLDLGLSCAAGMVADRLPFKGFDSVNSLEFRQWLAKHNAQPATINCAVVQ